MKSCGLVSISFRQHTVDEIIDAVKEAGLKYIEWGSDVHVPEGDAETAKAVKAKMDASGLKTSSYGSYYKLGQNQNIVPFLESAKALGTDIIRIWAGGKGSAETDEVIRKAWTTEAKEVCKKAAEYGIKIDFEYHPNTLTDCRDSAYRLLQEINEPNCGIYWQPFYKLSREENLKEAEKVMPYVDVLHLFYWENHSVRLFLKDAKEELTAYIKAFSGRDVVKLLEFVPDNDIRHLQGEAQTLFEILKEAEEYK